MDEIIQEHPEEGIAPADTAGVPAGGTEFAEAPTRQSESADTATGQFESDEMATLQSGAAESADAGEGSSGGDESADAADAPDVAPEPSAEEPAPDAAVDATPPEPEAPAPTASELLAESEHREVEAKFAIQDSEQARRLMWEPRPIPEFNFSDAAVHLYSDTYHDTDAYDLLRRGYALRVRERQGGGNPVVALKSLATRSAGPVMDRFEFQGPVAADGDQAHPGSWPVPVRAMVEFLAGRDAEVHPICQIRQRRVERAVNSEGIPVALMSVDEVAVVDPRAPQPSPSVDHFTELEAELAPGASMDSFRSLVATLMQLNVEAQTTSKLERGIEAVADRPAGRPEMPGVHADMDMAEAGRLIWRRQLAAMALNEAGAREGSDIEYVHDMRVATRRARSAARIFGDYFEPRAIRPVLKGLKKTADLLGVVRDLDVALAKLAESEHAPRQEPLKEAWDAERERANARLVRWLDARGYRKFLAELGHLASTAGLGARDHSGFDRARLPHQVRHTFPEAIVERYAIVRAYETVIDRPDLPVPVLHMLRIDCKRLRYVLEPVTDLIGDDGADLVKTLKKMQDVLGELNDAEVARTRVLELAAHGQGGPNLAEYLTAQEVEIERWVEALPERWKELVSNGYRSRLYKAVAKL